MLTGKREGTINTLYKWERKVDLKNPSNCMNLSIAFDVACKNTVYCQTAKLHTHILHQKYNFLFSTLLHYKVSY